MEALMYPSSLGALMEDISFLLRRVSLLVFLLPLPLGGWRLAHSVPSGSLYIRGTLEFPMMSKFTSAQRKAIQRFGLPGSLCWPVTAAEARGRGGIGSSEAGQARWAPQELWQQIRSQSAHLNPNPTCIQHPLPNPASKLCRTVGS